MSVRVLSELLRGGYVAVLRGPSRRLYVAESLEARTLLSSSIDWGASTFAWNVGQPNSIVGRLVDALGQPVAGVSISADDGLVQSQRQLGTTTPGGYFSLNYTASQTEAAGAGLYSVIVGGNDATATSALVLDLVDPAQQVYPLRGLDLSVGSGSSGLLGPANLAAAPADVGSWINSATKSLARKTASMTSLIPSPQELLNTGESLWSGMDSWLVDNGKDYISNPANDVALLGTTTCLAGPNPVCVAFVSIAADAVVQQLAEDAGHEVINNFPGMTADQRATANQILSSSAPVIFAAIDPAKGLLDQAVTALDLNWTFDQAAARLDYNPSGQPVALDIVGTGANGAETRVCSFRVPDSLSTTPTPSISGISPSSLSGLALPQTQTITISGSGFIPGSLLEFSDGTNVYANRIPSSETPNSLTYGIKVGNESAGWTATVVNSAKRSNAFPFTVTAQADDSPPAAPVNLTATYVGGPNQNLYVLDWTNPADSSGIKGVWFRAGSPPMTPTDGQFFDLPLGKPLPVANPTQNPLPVYLWLEDGAGHRDPTHAALALLSPNPTIAPAVATPTISPDGGSFAGGVQVTLSTATTGATIYFSLDGSNPTTASDLYTGPFTLSDSVTLKAKAFRPGLPDSAVATAAFAFSTSQPSLYVIVNRIVLPDAGASSNFIVYNAVANSGSMNFTVTSSDSWITVDTPSGSSSGPTGLLPQPGFHVAPFAGPGGRIGTLTISAPGALNSPQTIQVVEGSDMSSPIDVQMGNVYLTASPDSNTPIANPFAGETVYVKFTDNFVGTINAFFGGMFYDVSQSDTNFDTEIQHPINFPSSSTVADPIA